MKITLFVIFCLLASLTAYSQEAIEAPILADSSGFKKNEIGINLTPFAATMLGADFNGIPFGIKFKRHIKNNTWFTSGFYASFDNKDWRYPPVTFVMDSMLITQQLKSEYYTYSASAGLEKRRYTKSGIVIAPALELTWQYEDNREMRDNEYSVIDSVQNSGSPFQVYYTSNHRKEMVYQFGSVSQLFGATFSVTAMIPAGKRWWFNGRYQMSGLWGKTQAVYADHRSGKLQTTNSNYMSFASGMPFMEVAVMYRF